MYMCMIQRIQGYYQNISVYGYIIHNSKLQKLVQLITLLHFPWKYIMYILPRACQIALYITCQNAVQCNMLIPTLFPMSTLIVITK